jgi:hypothetical protein
VAPRKPSRPRGFGEAQGLRSFRRADPITIFEAYGYVCAFTGASLRSEAAADPHGYMLDIGGTPPSSDSGLLIPASIDIIHAYERGDLALGPSYEFLANLATISPELLERLNPIGRLTLPADRTLHPSQAAVTAHLIAFLRGRRT